MTAGAGDNHSSLAGRRTVQYESSVSSTAAQRNSREKSATSRIYFRLKDFIFGGTF